MNDIDLDPVSGDPVPCVVCSMSPQRGGTGCCSPECEGAVRDADAFAARVERAANAMYVARPVELDQSGETKWADLPEPWKQEWRDAARVALEA